MAGMSAELALAASMAVGGLGCVDHVPMPSHKRELFWC